MTSPARALDMLTRGKVLKLQGAADPARARGLVRFGADTVLADAPDPSCPATSSFELGLFTVATNRVQRTERFVLDCSLWRAGKRGWVHPGAGDIKKITYGPRGLVVKLQGAAVLPAAGPIAYAQVWFAVGERRFHGRIHQIATNRPDRIVSRKTSKRAADGEAGFWTVLLGDDTSEATQQRTLETLTRAAKRSKKDARSRFLLAMLRLYRFGQMTEDMSAPGPDATAELAAAVAAFDEADPLLWDRATRVGESRVPGFAAAARYSLGIATGDQALLARARVDLDYAIEINAFFNVFDLMAVAQAEPPASALFQQAFATMEAFLSDPSTLECAISFPEVCTDAGLAPTALPGTFVLFGDLYAKAGDADQARTWYTLAVATEGAWPFAGLGAERLATADARVAAYGDADPANDPPIIGAGPQACASCHHRPLAD
jgi:hypothetical protein